tara:strand:- start:283 stop:486 length:204 start_codon:yes stop_codon:yes gene_type:complete
MIPTSFHTGTDIRITSSYRDLFLCLVALLCAEANNSLSDSTRFFFSSLRRMMLIVYQIARATIRILL